MAKGNSGAAPAKLGLDGRRFWDQIAAEYDLNASELVILGAISRTIDTIRALDAAMEGQELTVRGSAGQLREHPLLSEGRQQRLALVRMLRQLDVPDLEELSELRSAAKSRKARRSASARWSG